MLYRLSYDLNVLRSLTYDDSFVPERHLPTDVPLLTALSLLSLETSSSVSICVIHAACEAVHFQGTSVISILALDVLVY